MADPLPTSANPAPLNVNLVPQQGFNLNVLNQALQNNSITQEDLLKAARNPDLVALQNAQSASQIQDLQTLPIRRQQEIDANKQAARLRDLNIQIAGEQYKDALDPSRVIRRNVYGQQYGSYVGIHGDEPLPRDPVTGQPSLSAIEQQNVKDQLAIAQRNLDIKAAEEQKQATRTQYSIHFGGPLRSPDGSYNDAAMEAALTDLGGTVNLLPEPVAKQLASLDEMQDSVNRLKPMFQQRGGNWWNYVTGTIMKANPLDEHRQAIDAELAILRPLLVTGLYGNRSTGSASLKDDPKAQNPLLPDVTQKPEVFADRLLRLDHDIARTRESVLREQELSKRDVSRFRKSGPGVLPYPGMTPPAATTEAPPEATTPPAAPVATAKSYGLPAVPSATKPPGTESVNTEVKVNSMAELAAAMSNPAYPAGTKFIDPKGTPLWKPYTSSPRTISTPVPAPVLSPTGDPNSGE